MVENLASPSEEINRRSWTRSTVALVIYLAMLVKRITLAFVGPSQWPELYFRSNLLSFLFRLMTLNARRIFSRKPPIFPLRFSINVYFNFLLTVFSFLFFLSYSPQESEESNVERNANKCRVREIMKNYWNIVRKYRNSTSLSFLKLMLDIFCHVKYLDIRRKEKKKKKEHDRKFPLRH